MTNQKSLQDLAGKNAASIPKPSSHRLLRFGIPVLIVGIALALLLVTAWSALVPARTVQAVTVAVRPGRKLLLLETQTRPTAFVRR